MVAKTDAGEEGIEAKVFGKSSTIFDNAITPHLFLCQALSDPERAGDGGTFPTTFFTEPATADGYARLPIASAFTASTPDPDTGISNAIQAQMNTAGASWAQIRWGGIARSITRGTADALLLDVLTDGKRAICTVNHNNQVFTAPGHAFTVGMLLSFRVPPGGAAPAGITASITTQYYVTAADISAGTFSIANEDGTGGPGTAVTITSDGSVLATRVIQLSAGQVAANTAVTFDAGTISYAEG